MRFITHILLLFVFTGISLSQDNLKYIRQIDSLGNIKKVTLQTTTFDEAENVLVLYNINYREDNNNNNIWDGYEIAEYYQNKRNIPNENIAAISTSTDPEISRAEYDTYYDNGLYVGIKQQVEEILQTRTDNNGIPLRSKIKYIVLTKGIPYKIHYLNYNVFFLADYASVDASLALIFNDIYEIRWHLGNPYYRQDPEFTGLAPFIPEFYDIPGSPRLSFLVTRLDGYNVEDVKSMIDKSFLADSTSKSNTFILDGAQKTYDRMEEAASILNSMEATVYPDPWVDEPDHILTLEDSVVAIVTHGVHAGLTSSYINDLYDFKLADGAIFSSYESINGASFSKNINFGQGQIADFISIGGSGAIGNVYEPYASNISDESVLFPAYYSGYTFAEAAYMSLKRIDWTAIVVGDPLMRIGTKPQPQNNQNFRVLSINPNSFASYQSTRTVARIVFNDVLDTLNLPNFLVQQTGDTLKSYTHNQSLYLWPPEPLPNGTLIRFTADDPIYSVSGDSIPLTQYALFRTAPVDQQPRTPYVYDAYPAGIDIDINEDLIFIFSSAMKPETVYPILGSPDINQTHQWIDNSILIVTHTPFQQGTQYSFFLDEHTKSIDDVPLMQNFRLNFETGFNSIVYDVDNDNFQEFALNLNNTMLDGYETYEDNNGVRTSVYDVSDINNDNQNEFFVKLPQNNFPSFFWNPNAIPFTGYIDACVTVDDDEDKQSEYAFDFNGTGYFTHVYDPGDINYIREIKFVLLNSTPADQQKNVTPANTLKLQFSAPPVLNSLAGNITSDPFNSISSIYTAKNGTEVNVQFSEKFPSESDIIIVISKDIFSINDESLPHDYNIHYQTSGGQPPSRPRVTSFYPGDSLKISDNTPTVRFVFSNSMQTDLSTPVVVDTTNSELWTHYWAANNILYMLPLQELQGNKNYVFNLSPDLQDQTGQYLTGKTSFNFTSNEIIADNNKPTILQIVPDPGSIIKTEQKIQIIYSEFIKSTPDQWFTLQPQQFYNWNGLGSNMYSFNGNPGWKPQSNLDIQVQGLQVYDGNLNSSYLSYLFNFYVLGDLVERDIDKDGLKEYVIDNNNNLNDGFDSYVDPGGIMTYSLFKGDINNDGFFDFLITDSSGNNLLTWYPTLGDSGLIGYTEKIANNKYDVSIDTDNLVEFNVDTDSLTVQPSVPRVRTIKPADGSDYVAVFEPLFIQFNMQMDAFSVVQSVVFSFSQTGNWTNGHFDSRYKFEPQNGWLPGIVQTISVKPTYTALNQKTGKDSLNISFRTADNEGTKQGSLSWKFPMQNDTVHSQADYYFGFNQVVDTTASPEFTFLQDFSSLNNNNIWYNDTILKIYATDKINTGNAVLKNEGIIKFLNSLPLNFNGTTNFFISDSLALHLVRPLFNKNDLIPITPKLSLLFNQPLDSNIINFISFSQIVNSDTIPVDFQLFTDNNLLTVEPIQLSYSTKYQLWLAAKLKGISGRDLGEEKIFSLFTEEHFTPVSNKLEWKETDDFLIVNWPLPDTRQNTFDLFLSDNFTEKPDTISYSNLYNTTNVPSWLFDLQKFPKQAFINIRLRSGKDTFWSLPIFANNSKYNTGDLLSLPLTNDIQVDTLHLYQKYLHTISQWSEHVPGWNSTTYLSDLNQWSANLRFIGNKGILARTAKNGYIVWVQNLPQTIRLNESQEQKKQYHALINPYVDISAEDLAEMFENGSRIAIWDNNQQGWNEAVYDSVNGYWINNFTLDFMQPVYVYNTGGFDQTIHISGLAKAIMQQFPSQTKIFYADILSMRIYKNGIEKSTIVGCGVDSVIHAAYINIGNLDTKDEWLFEFYDKFNRFIDEYRYGINGEDFIKPLEFKLAEPYPNPFNNEITLPIAIPGRGKIDIKIFNVLGQLVHNKQILINGPQNLNYRWKSSNATGVYFIRATYKNKSDFTKVLLIK